MQISGELAQLDRLEDAYQIGKIGLQSVREAGLPRDVIQTTVHSLGILGGMIGRHPQQVMSDINQLLGVPPSVTYLGDLTTQLLQSILTNKLTLKEAKSSPLPKMR